eukprot:121330_1
MELDEFTTQEKQPLIGSTAITTSEPLQKNETLCDFREDLYQIGALITGAWVNLLLLFIPLSIASHYLEWAAPTVFFLNFIGMIPLASILGDATECVASHLGPTAGGFLNATFGNAVEIVVMVFVLLKAKEAEAYSPREKDILLNVVQTSLLGSVFSNTLLVLGCSFVANGYVASEASFNITATSTHCTLLMITALVMLLPGAYSYNIRAEETDDILHISRAAALILMVMYFCYLIFILSTHKEEMNVEQYLPNMHSYNSQLHFQIPSDEDEDDGQAKLTLIASLTVLVITTFAITWLSDYLTDAITPMARDLELTASFVGIILLPVVGNVPEHITSMKMALKDKMNISLSITIGSATQVATFVVSLAVITAWIIDLDLTLAFDPFETNLFIYSTIIIFAVIYEGSSNWLEGAMLLGLYVLIAVLVYHQSYCSDYTKAAFHGDCHFTNSS